MQRTRIKICGVRDAATAVAAVRAGADAIGVVFAAGSPRVVTPAQAREIVRGLPAFVEPVGLFVDAKAEEVRAIAQEVGLRTAQLHGQESPEMAAALAPLCVIKAMAFVPEKARDAIEQWVKQVPNLAGILWDAPSGGGGTGQGFDWSALAKLQTAGESNARNPQPATILAGGLTPENVGRAISLVEPYAVDVSSGVESSRGVKDPAKIRAFCEAVRAADQDRRG